MKTTEVFFESTNFVGRQIENVQDLVKALAAGMDIASSDECGYPLYEDKELTDEFGNTSHEDVERDENEVFEEMKKDLEEGHGLYAGLFLDGRRFSIMPAKKTTLQTDFSVGQEVYLLVDNKVVKTKIKQIWLTEGENNIQYSYRIANDICMEFYNRCQTIHHNTSTFNYICSEIDNVKVKDKSFASVEFNNGRDKLVELSKIFATKEELVKHLMEE